MRGIIFDLDGTLLDTIGDLAAAMNRALLKHGYSEHPLESFNMFIGDGARTLVERSLPEADGAQAVIVDKVLADFYEDYAASWEATTAVFPGVMQLLSDLSKDGKILAVLSNKPDRYMQEIRKMYFSDIDFAAFCGKRDCYNPKPDPAGGLDVARQMGLEPADILYVGDSSTDMKTACNCGFYACGVSWGYRSVDELMATGAKVVVDLPEQIYDLVASASVR